jgi:hypothetical protein
VAASRARHLTQLYAVTDAADCLADEAVAHQPISARDVIEQALQRPGSERTAVETLRAGTVSRPNPRRASEMPAHQSVAAL